MQKEKSLDRLILRYSGAAAAVLAAGNAHAQPDTILTVVDTSLTQNGQRFDIDLDTNGVVDFRITQIIDSTNMDITGVIIQGRGAAVNQVLGLDYGNYNYPFRLNVGDTIGPGKPFSGLRSGDRIGYLGITVDGATYPNSQFTGGVTDGFLGVRFEGTQDSVQQTYYGWVRVDVASDLRSISIRDFAYVTRPDSLIRAGFGSPINTEEPRLPAELPILVQRGTYLDYDLPEGKSGPTEIFIYDLSGRQVDHLECTNRKGSFDLSVYPHGIYVASLRNKHAEVSKKIVVY